MILSFGFTAFWIVFDFSSGRGDSPNYAPFIAALVGYNAGEITRMKKLKREVPAS
ncbi:hypothetical protein [Jeotgalibacillus proteolyticus]|uniref:hypothetical protein n=1 Tax=Jeotgalibacillus proteolyticus TaxID=2082395 RepID=UPI001431DA8E|nr:hypothetical protein [Jeotgalibacillus proteolyticus]